MIKKIYTLLLLLVSANIYAQINSSSFAPKVDYVSGVGTSNPYGIIAADLDNDGKSDVISGNLNNSISVFRNISTTTSIALATKFELATLNPVNFPHAADLDGDGKIDLITSINSGTSISVFRNTTAVIGTITFAARMDVASANLPGHMDIADVDGDLKPDLVTSNYNSGSFSIFRNTSTSGTISFASRIDITCGSNPSSVNIVDLDGDNKKDIAVTLYNVNQIVVYRNTTISPGSPTFVSAVTLSTSGNPNFLKSADFDGDGKKDLITGNIFGNNFSVCKNLTPAVNSIAFQSTINFPSGSGTSSCQGIGIADYDKDNKLDIAVCNRGNNTVSVFRNNTVNGIINSSSFAAQVIFATNSAPSDIFPVDLNMDYLPDFICSNNVSNNISIFKNQIIEPTNPASNLVFSNFGPASVTLTFTKGNGGRRIVLARAGSAINSNPVDSYMYTANTTIGLGDQIGSGNFVVYNDTGRTVTVTGLQKGLNYFSVYEYNGNGIFTNYLISPNLSGNVNILKPYFSKSTGNLNDLGNWGTNPDGTGSAPNFFTDSNCVFYVVNNTTPALNGNWIVGGYNSFVVFGDGSIVYNLNIPAIYGIGIDSVVVRNNITLSIQGSLGVNKSYWENGSTALYYGSSAQTLVGGNYYNLQVVGGSKDISGDIIVRNNLTMTASINTYNFLITLGTGTANCGTLSRTSGTINGKFKRWYANTTNTGASGLFPIGTSANYRPLSIEYTGAPTTGGTYLAEFISTNPGILGLPVFDNPVLVSTTGINGFWRLTNNGISGGTFTSTATATGFFSVNDYTQVKMLCRTSSNWSIPGTSVATGGSNAAPIISRSGLTTNTWEFCVGGDPGINPLPVKLISAVAKYLDETVILNWQTASEENCSHFEIEKLVNGEWKFLDKVSGAGNSTQINNYRFIDKYIAKNLTENAIYYRLKQVDLNGKFEYSEVLMAELEISDGGLKLGPVPMQDELSIHINGSEIINHTEIYDLSGKLLCTQYGQNKINVSALPKGIYLVHVFTDKQTFVQKVVK